WSQLNSLFGEIRLEFRRRRFHVCEVLITQVGIEDIQCSSSLLRRDTRLQTTYQTGPMIKTISQFVVRRYDIRFHAHRDEYVSTVTDVGAIKLRRRHANHDIGATI